MEPPRSEMPKKEDFIMAPGFEPTTSVINQSIKSSFKPEERAEFAAISSEDHLTSTFRLQSIFHRLWLSSVIFLFRPIWLSAILSIRKEERASFHLLRPQFVFESLKVPKLFFHQFSKIRNGLHHSRHPALPRPFRSPFFLPDEKSKIANADVWQSGRYIFKCALCRLTKFKQQS